MADKHTKEMSKNHRERLRKRYAAGGADSFDDYLLMELLLFDFIPRVDTYPTAHRLIDEFGTLEKVFKAHKEDLMKIKGIGQKTAERIVFYGDVMERLISERLSCVPFISRNSVSPYLLWIFRTLEADTACLLLLNSKGILIEKNIFMPHENTEGSLISSVESILKSRKPKYAILAHKHPCKLEAPSGADLSVTEAFRSLCETEGVVPLEHYIVTDDSVTPII